MSTAWCCTRTNSNEVCRSTAVQPVSSVLADAVHSVVLPRVTVVARRRAPRLGVGAARSRGKTDATRRSHGRPTSDSDARWPPWTRHPTAGARFRVSRRSAAVERADDPTRRGSDRARSSRCHRHRADRVRPHRRPVQDLRTRSRVQSARVPDLSRVVRAAFVGPGIVDQPLGVIPRSPSK